jgi:hypothetical protein
MPLSAERRRVTAPRRSSSSGGPALLAALGLAAIAAVVAAISYMRPGCPGGPCPGGKSPTSTRGAFAVDQERTVRFTADAEALEALPPDEIEDQLRDWLLYAVLAESELGAAGLRDTMYDVPPTRAQYLSPIAAFEFGVTRVRVIDAAGTTIALIPAGSANRDDLLAQVADIVRTRLGGPPPAMRVFEYTLDPLALTAQVKRTRDIAGAKLFTSAYGYVQKEIRSVADLKAFLAEANDLVLAEPVSGGLRVGGRRVPRARAQALRVEDVAALVQSEMFLADQQKQLDDLEAKWNQPDFQQQAVEQALARSQTRFLDSTNVGVRRAILEAGYKDARATLARELGIRDGSGPPPGSGFSLDPVFHFEKLSDVLLRRRPALARLVSTDELDAAAAALRRRDATAFLELLRKVRQRRDGASLVSAIEGEVNRARFQHARYDGLLKGTEVGMVLFYTDLLAKLWALNYLDSAPDRPSTDAYVPGFVPLIKTSVSPIYAQELAESPGTRLWFGPRDSAFAKTTTGLVFARVATRVYAASTSTLAPGEEAEANAGSARFLSWWNDHYASVAEYEPEYERLNQIVKWSVIVAWSRSTGRLPNLDFLDSGQVPVTRDRQFARWAQANTHLRFRDWAAARFLPDGHQGSDTEALEILSWQHRTGSQISTVSGGVSLAAHDALKQRQPLPLDVPSGLRRPNVTELPSPSPGARALKAGDRTSATAYTLPSAQADAPATVESLATRTFQDRSATGGLREDPAKLRGNDVELAPGGFKTEFIETRAEQRTLVAHNDQPIAELSVTRAEGGLIDARFMVHRLEQSRSFSNTLNQAVEQGRNAGEALALRPEVKQVIEADGTYYVESPGSNGWLRISPEGAPRAELAPGEALRASTDDLSADGRSSSRWNVAFVEPADVVAKLTTLERYRVVWAPAAPEPGAVRSVWARGPPSPPGGGSQAPPAGPPRDPGAGGGGNGIPPFGPRFIFTPDESGRPSVRVAPEGRRASLDLSARFIEAAQFKSARLELDVLAQALPGDYEVQTRRAIAHVVSDSRSAAAELLRLSLQSERAAVFLEAADRVAPHLRPGSQSALDLDAAVRGVMARARGHDVGFIGASGHTIGIEQRLSSFDLQRLAASDGPPLGETIIYADFLPEMGTTPVPIDTGSITAKLIVPEIARYRPERLVDRESGRTLWLLPAGIGGHAMVGPGPGPVSGPGGESPPPPPPPHGSSFTTRFLVPCPEDLDHEPEPRPDCRPEVYVIERHDGPPR